MDLDIGKANGLPPVEPDDARLLILGTFPGELAIKRREYYAERRNKFWEITGRLLGASRDLLYEERLCRLESKGIALWDVVAACQRQGSVDSAMQQSSIEVNDFVRFLDRHARIAVICFNGKKAKEIWDDYVVPSLFPNVPRRLCYWVLPCTSGNNTHMTFDEKLSSWRSVLCKELGCNQTGPALG